MLTPRTEFAQALKAIANERGLDASVILETIKQAIVAAYKRDARERGEETEDFEYDVLLDPVNGEAKVFAWPALPVEEEESETEDSEEIEKKREELKAQKKDVTPPGFGRIAAQTAKQVIHQKIKEAEKDAILDEYSGRIGGLISGMILRFDGPNVLVDLGRTEGVMPAAERTPNERLNPNQRLSFLLKEIQEGMKGKRLILSRSDANFVRKLFEREVPEMGSGSVEVKAIAREAGVRTKIAVYSNQPGVDPVGSCVGQKGIRVQSVTNELGGERVDIVSWNDNVEEFIKAALSPAEGLTVKLDKKEKVAHVKAPEDQLSLAIGRDGQNARLASKLAEWRIEVESDGSKPEVKDEEKPEAKDEKKPKVKKEEKSADENVNGSKEEVVEETKEVPVSENIEEEKKESDSN